MARSIFYRTKSPQGPWVRAAGTVPYEISGLANDTTYEVDIGDGALIDVTPTASYSEAPFVADGGDYLTGPGRIADAGSFLFFASYRPTTTGRKSLLSVNGINGAFYTWDGLVPRFACATDAGFLLLAGPGAASHTRLHLLMRGFADSGSFIVEGTVWNGADDAWSSVFSTSVPGSTVQLETGTTEDYRILQRSGSTNHGFIGDAYRIAFWTGTAPDISLGSVREAFADGGAIVDPAISTSAFGIPIIDAYGPAARMNAGTNAGSDGAFSVAGSFEDG
ncbi:MAG: hypothetical protein AAF771_03335 [Pseudomonadota bacterium]